MSLSKECYNSIPKRKSHDENKATVERFGGAF